MVRPLSKKELVNLVMDSFLEGAKDSGDCYMYVSKLVPVKFEEVNSAWLEVFGNAVSHPATPIGATLH
jgi:hypothetical protein